MAEIGMVVGSTAGSRSPLPVAGEPDTLFLISIDPPLACGDLRAVLVRLRESWPPERLVELFASPLAPVVKTAATCLGLTGTARHCGRLAALLKHSDEQVARAAENALWSIWMRAGSEDANGQLAAAVEQHKTGDFGAALRVLDALLKAEGSFAEAHHQRGLALHSLERYEEAGLAYQQALALNPHHFAALAGLGHICAEQDDFAGALRYYRRALDIHPRLTEIGEIVPQLEAALKRRVVA